MSERATHEVLRDQTANEIVELELEAKRIQAAIQAKRRLLEAIDAAFDVDQRSMLPDQSDLIDVSASARDRVMAVLARHAEGLRSRALVREVGGNENTVKSAIAHARRQGWILKSGPTRPFRWRLTDKGRQQLGLSQGDGKEAVRGT